MTNETNTTGNQAALLTPLSPESRELFLRYLAEAPNWTGCPLWDPMGINSKRDCGFLTHWKKLGLCHTEDQEGANGVGWDQFLYFSDTVQAAWHELF